MTIRSHLLVLTLAALLPVSIFGIAATLWAADRERAAFEDGARDRTLALLTAVDTELGSHVTSLQTLASSYDLQTGDLEGFQRQATRLLPMHKNWKRITLTLPSGEGVLTISPSASSTGRIGDRKGLHEALQSSRPTIRSLSQEEDGYAFGVRVPVAVNGETFVLGVLVDPRAILSLLTPQRLRSGWVGVVLDQNRRIVASTVDHSRFVGEPASQSLQDSIGKASEGWFPGTTIDGREVYIPYSQSMRSGWTVAMEIPADYVEGITEHTMLLLAVGLLLAISIAILLAAGFGRRIAEPMAALAVAATALGNRAKVSPPTDAPVREVRDISRALLTSAQAVGEREEKLRAADHAKDEFLAMLGHELRNPLGALTSAAQILNFRGSSNGTATDAVAIVSRQVERMTRLVDDLLDVGRATSGKVRLKLAPLDLGRVVSQVIDNLHRGPVFDDREMQTDISSAWIEGDEARIEQVVTNLLENAGKYTPRGGTIAVRVSEVGQQTMLEVIDNGIGISPDLLPRIFDLFAQGQRAIDRSTGGLGIGLTLAKRLTELHRGTITAESAGTDKGARFALHFPAVPAPSGAPLREAGSVSIGSARRILLIEDNEDARHALVTMLRHYGYRVFAAADGLEGIALADEVRPDAAIVDIGLPEYDGFEVARQLRADFGQNQIFLVAVTGYSAKDTRSEARRAGFDEYLIKPVSPKELAELIEGRFGSTADMN